MLYYHLDVFFGSIKSRFWSKCHYFLENEAFCGILYLLKDTLKNIRGYFYSVSHKKGVLFFLRGHQKEADKNTDKMLKNNFYFQKK